MGEFKQKLRYSLELRARATPDTTIEKKHASFIEALRNVRGTWGIADREAPETPILRGDDLSASVKLTHSLPEWAKGHVLYSFRGKQYLRDAAVCDDFVDIIFNPLKVDYADLVRHAISDYIGAFGAYLAQIGPDYFVASDVETVGVLDARWKLFRIYPVCFFDAILCKRALRLTPNEVADRVDGVASSVQLTHGGVLLVASDQVLSIADAEQLNVRFRALLGLNR